MRLCLPQCRVFSDRSTCNRRPALSLGLGTRQSHAWPLHRIICSAHCLPPTSFPCFIAFAPCPWPCLCYVLVQPNQPTQPPSSRDRARSLTKPSPRQDNRLRPPRTVSTTVRSPLRVPSVLPGGVLIKVSRARPGHRPLLRSLRSDTRHLWILCAHCHGIVLLVSSPLLTWIRRIRPKLSMHPVTNLLLRFEDWDRSHFQSHSGVSVCRVGILQLCTSLAN